MSVLSTSNSVFSRAVRLQRSHRYAIFLRDTLSPHPRTLFRHYVFRSVSSGSASKAPTIPSSSRLKGTTCMVTGGASGIGFAIAQRFLRDGAEKIILVGRRKDRLMDALDRLRGGEQAGISQEAYELPGSDGYTAETSSTKGVCDITSSDVDSRKGEWTSSPAKTEGSTEPGSEGHDRSGSAQLEVIPGDVGDPSFWSDQVKKTMDSVDILINAAGVSRSALLPLAKDEHIEQVLRTNLQGTILACRAMTRRALRQQRKQSSPDGAAAGKTKCIINVSSLHATKGGIGASTYASTKAGVIALTRAIAAEGSLSASGASVRANVIVPGYIETEMLGEFSDSFRTEAEQSIPLKRFGTAEEVADAATFLATNQYANNCVLNLDGGLSAM